jgi:ATP-binding cassette, subfamily B, bacterial
MTATAWLWALVRRRPRWAAEFVVMSLLRAVCTMAVVYLIQRFLAGVLGAGAGQAAALSPATTYGLTAVAAALGAAYCLGAVVSYRGQVVEQRLIRDLELGVMERLTRHLLSLSIDFFDRSSPGDLVVALRQDITRLRTVAAAQARMVFEAAQAAGLIGAAVWLSPKLALLSLVLVPALAWPALRLARRTLRQSFSIRSHASAMYDVLLQALRGIRVIRVFGGEASEGRRSAEAARRFFEASLELTRLEAFGRVLVEVVAGFTVVIVVVAGGFDVLRGTMEWPTLLAFLLAIRSVHGPLNNVNAQYLEAQRHGASLKRIEELLRETPSVRSVSPAIDFPSPLRSVEFDNVSFERSGKSILRQVCLRMDAGETIGIVGPSGAGKSTLLALLARFYDPTQGQIRVNGRDLRTIELESLYQQIALVPQQPFLFAASIAENIRFGRPDATARDIEAAATSAELHHDIVSWPEGYDTRIGVGGRALSEGEAQRVNLARALIKNAPVLILDEASASLDSITEARTQRALEARRADGIVVVVAHRLSTVRHADRIVVIDDGAVAAVGTHDELLRTSALYRDLWAPQELVGSLA